MLESAVEIQEQQSNGIEADINGLISKVAEPVTSDSSTFIAAATAYANFLSELSERDINAITNPQLGNIIAIDTADGFKAALVAGSLDMSLVEFNLDLTKFQGKYTASGDTWNYEEDGNGLSFVFNHDFKSLPENSRPDGEVCTIKLNMDPDAVKESDFIKMPQVFADTLFVGSDTLAWGKLDLRNNSIKLERGFGSLSMLFDNSSNEKIVKVLDKDEDKAGLFEIRYNESEESFSWVIGDMQNGIQFGGSFDDMKEFISILTLNIGLVSGGSVPANLYDRLVSFNGTNDINFSYYNNGDYQHGEIRLVFTPSGSSNNEKDEDLGYNRINIILDIDGYESFEISAPIESIAILTRDIIEAVINIVINEVAEGIQDFVDAVVNNFINAVGNVLGAIDDYIDARISDYISFRNMVINAIETEVQRVTNACISIYIATMNYIDGFATIYKNYTEAMFNQIAGPWISYFSGIVSTIGNYQAQIIGHMAEPWINLIEFINRSRQ